MSNETFTSKYNRINRGVQRFKVYNYWTNFSRSNNEVGQYKILEEDPNNEDYWWFQTNIDPEYMDIQMSPRDIKVFLLQMMEHYPQGSKAARYHG